MPEDKVAPRRDRILSAAVQEFARHGFAGARMERVAVAAGVNKQLLFHYFQSKDGLHRAALASVLERFPPDSPPGGPPAERLAALLAQLVAAAHLHPALVLQLASPGNGSGAGAVNAWRDAATSEVRRILQDGQREGYLRDDVDVDAVSKVIIGASLGCAAAGGQETAGRIEQYAKTLLRMAIDYCAWR